MAVEGSLYLLERSIEPFFQIFVLNRKSRVDFDESLEVDTEFTEKGNFVAYAATLADGFPARRTIFFAAAEEKDQFMQAAQQAIEDLKKMQGLESGSQKSESNQ